MRVKNYQFKLQINIKNPKSAECVKMPPPPSIIYQLSGNLFIYRFQINKNNNIQNWVHSEI